MLTMCTATPKNIITDINKSFILFNGHWQSLGDIFGSDISPKKIRFTPGSKIHEALLSDSLVFMDNILPADINMLCAGNEYINRRFEQQQTIPTRELFETDTPTALAIRITNDITNNLRQPKIIVLQAYMGMGKTIALAKIKYEISQLMPTAWIVDVDLLNLHNNERAAKLTYDYIIKSSIPNDELDLFVNLMKINPKKIIIMLDNIDSLVGSRIGEIMHLIETFVKKQVKIVLAARPDFTFHLKRNQFRSRVYNIPEFTLPEITQYLINIWKTAIQEKATITPLITRALEEYAMSFTTILNIIEFPRQPQILARLAKEFTRRATILSHTTVQQLGCLDYVLDRTVTREKLDDTLHQASINMHNFIHDYLNSLDWYKYNTNCYDVLYGVTALQKIGARNDIDADKKINPRGLATILKRDVIRADHLATANNNALYMPLTITNNNNNNIIDFIHPLYERYFAGQYLVTLINERSLHMPILRVIFSDERYKYVMEYMNFQATKLNPTLFIKILLRYRRKCYDILDNILKHGFEDLYIIINNNIDLNILRVYYQTWHRIITPSNRVAGMIIPQIENTKSLTKLELMVEHDMVRALTLLHNSNVFETNGNYDEVLTMAFTKSVPNLNLMVALVKFVPQQMWPKIDVSAILYDVIDKVGAGCQFIIDAFFQNPIVPPLIQKNGRTLLHVGVKTGDKELVRHLVEKWKVTTLDTIDDSQMSVFMTALNSNPTAIATLEGWWDMMAYLLQTMSTLITIPHDTMTDEVATTAASVDDSFYRDLMLADNIKISSEIAIRTMSLKYSTIRKIDPQILSQRQKHLFKELAEYDTQVSTLEILARFRGNGRLSDNDHMAFREAIGTSLSWEQKSLKPQTRIRILTALTDNIASAEDVNDIIHFINHDLLQNVPEESLTALSTKLYALMEHYKISPLTLIKLRPLAQESLQDMLESIIPETDSLVDDYDLMLTCFGDYRRRRSTSTINCPKSLKDLTAINDDNKRHGITKIHVNSDKFLQSLAHKELNNLIQARQLVQFVQKLQNNLGNKALITGNSQMLARDILRHGSWTAYRQNQRVNDIIDNLWHPLSGTKAGLTLTLPSRTLALYAAASLPLIRAIYGTINMCLQKHNDTDNNCAYTSGILALSATLPAINFLSARYTPWIIDRFSRTVLDMLPSTTPNIIRNNVKFLRTIGLQYGAKSVAIGLGIAGIGFDLYNIVEISMALDKCKHLEACLDKDKIDYIISLTFSCVSIVVAGGMMISGVGFVPGLILGLGLMALEMFASGTNDVVHYTHAYHTNFDENLRIFINKILFKPPPSDVQALEQRIIQINFLQQRVHQFLATSDMNIVAYGIGLGNLQNGQIIASSSTINMRVASDNNTDHLSRVLPLITDNATLLCLPKRNKTALYDKYQNINHTDAVYRCRNAFVIGHNQRWNNHSHESHIIFDLEYIENGEIVGSNDLNNVFLIHNGRAVFNIIGGNGPTVDTYLMYKDTFRGNILLNGLSIKNILDFSPIHQSNQSNTVHFTWSEQLHTGSVRFGSNEENSFFIMSPHRSPKLHIIGRAQQPDTFTCSHSQHITIDGRGGKTSSNMDHIDDCRSSIIHPFTLITGSRHANNLSYTTYISLTEQIVGTDNAYAVIQPQQSKFSVIFRDRPLLAVLHSVKYLANNNSLLWELAHKHANLLLVIEPYRIINSKLQQNNTDDLEITSVSCIFTDSYTNTTIFPVLNFSTNNSAIMVQQFNVFGLINSTQLNDVLIKYRELNAFAPEDELLIVTKLMNPTTGQSYIFGSGATDRFYIDGKTKFIFGGNGPDVYLLNGESLNVCIDNEADDVALDTLIITNITCPLLRAVRGSTKLSCCDNSSYDVTLICSDELTMTTLDRHIVLRNYLLDSRHRHLQIYWRDATYILIPDDWQEVISDNVEETIIKLALLFSFDDQTHKTTLTLTSQDSLIVFNITDETNPLVAYKLTNNDVILARKYVNNISNSFVVLQNFFINGTTNVSIDWNEFKIFVINNDNGLPSILTVNNILNSLDDTLAGNSTREHPGDDLIEEYVVNITRTKVDIIIDHNNDTLLDG